jgi:hypothetical protein
MRKIIAAFALFATFTLSAQSPKSSEFQGRVKSVEEHSFKAKQSKGVISRGKRAREYSTDYDFKMEYDSIGRPSKRTWISMKGNIIKVLYYTYDSTGLLVNEKSEDGDNNPLFTFTYHREFNASGKLTTMMVSASTVSKSTVYHYTYDDKNNQFESRQTGEGNQILNLETRTFNAKSQITRQYIYNANNTLWGYEEYNYDEEGNCIQKTLYNDKKEIIIIYRWKYEDKKILLRYEVCGNTGMNCETWIYRYEYDQTGNWIQRIEFRNGKLMFVKEREIIYW